MIPIGATQLLARPQSNDVLAIDSAGARRSALVFDLSSAVPTCRAITLPTAIARCAAMPDQSTFIALTPGGDLGLLSPDAKAVARPTEKASHLGAVESARPTRLFDDLFGSSSILPPVVSATSYDAPLRKVVGDDLFAAPAHVLPPLRMLWRHALPLRPLATDRAEEPVAASVPDEAMDVDEPAMPPRELPPLSASETEALSAIFGARLRVSAASS